jgi:alkane 1-monooxygenase
MATDDKLFGYRDTKRAFWPLAAAAALIPVFSIMHYQTYGETWILWLNFFIFYGFVPIIEILFGEDESNPPREAIPALRDDKFYRWTAFSTLPLCYATWLTSAWFIATVPLNPWGYAGATISAGMVAAGALNTAHEVGHRRDKIAINVARFLLILCGMGHFRVEHNFGHHVQVATPEDSATAPMGMNFYQFVLTELPGGIARAWRIERERLARKNISQFSLQNEVFLNGILTLLLYAGVTLAFGILALPFAVAAAIWANLMLSSANYIEHYGLMRQKRDDGRYERVQPHHSWNSNHVVSNVLLLHLQRHSDHHAHAERPYQCLRHFDTSPQLPAGYFTMYLAAWIPPVWFKIMDPLVAKQMQGDMTKAYIKPSYKDKVMEKWHNPNDGSVPAE